MQNKPIKTSTFTHKGFILAVSGAAIGIGSIWRMPYLIGENGGSLFILFYLLFIFILGIPAMAAEILIGKIGRKSPAKSLASLTSSTNSSNHWKKIAWAGTLASVIILSFYCVVSGWCLKYMFIFLNGMKLNSSSEAQQVFDNFISQPFNIVAYTTIFVLMTFSVSKFKVNQGIEKLNDILMPLLYIVLLALIIYAITLPEFYKAMKYLLIPKWNHLNSSMLITSMGMAFFTLATGACCLMAYGAHMPEKQSILFSVSIVAAINIFVIICAGVAIFSIVFSYGMDATSGPGLIFIALPVALHDMPGGTFITPIFFFLLIIACWTSSVNLAEPIVAALTDKTKKRSKGVLLSALIVWALSLIPSFSFNLLKNVTFFKKDIFSLYTGFATDILLPITGFFILIFTGFVMRKQIFYKGLNLNKFWGLFWYCIIRFISPTCLLIVFLSSITI